MTTNQGSDMAVRIADPLLGVPPERVQLASAPLVRVLGQVQFAKIIKISDETHIGNFQEAVRVEYPFIEKDSAKGIQLVVDGGGVQAVSTDEVIWRLFDSTRQWRVSLNTSALTLETMLYTSRTEFLDRFKFLLGALVAAIRPSVATRVGFRYVNRLDRNEDLNDLDKLVHTELIGVLAAPVRPQVEQVVSQALCKTAEGNLMVRWGMLPAGTSHDPDAAPPHSSTTWMLDIDSFATEGVPQHGFSADDLAQLVKTMADRAYAFFRWSVKDEFLERFGASRK